MKRLCLALALASAAAPSYAQSSVPGLHAEHVGSVPGSLVRDGPPGGPLRTAGATNATVPGGAVCEAAHASTSPCPAVHPQERAVATDAGWTYDPSVGLVYRTGDFRAATWGFAERLFNPDGADSWRRVRQGAELDFPRVTQRLRPAFVYEVDFTDNDFFRAGARSKVFENLFLAVQDAESPGRFRALVGENTHVLSREDNLSSGNLPTINRSLVLEEHGSVNSFGTQFGVQAQRALSPRYTLAVSAQDNRGSLNTDDPRWAVGNSLAAKITALAVDDPERGRRLTTGLGVDVTRNIEDRRFTLASAIGADPLGATEATGNKVSAEADVAYTSRIGTRPYAVEAEGLFSTFSGSGTRVGGGYVQAQVSAFSGDRAGDLDPFLRVDVVRLGRDGAGGSAFQQAWRAGVNYNLPHAARLLNLHLEYAWNSVRGPAEIVLARRSFGEFRVGLRVNAARYVRY